ncbi:MAG: DUF2891 domain-containing protein [Zavarzinella sp.]
MNRLFFTVLLAALTTSVGAGQAPKTTMKAIDSRTINQWAGIALKGIQQEYPNKPGHVLNGPEDAKTPRGLHPAFYGCYDWHSAVHSHWMLVKLLKSSHSLEKSAEIRKVISSHLSKQNIAMEAKYFVDHPTFERTYGWAWLLKLAEELSTWDDPDAKGWLANLKPLVDVIIAGYTKFLPKQTYPIRTGVHPNTAFGLVFAYDYAKTTNNKVLLDLIAMRSSDYFGEDVDAPIAWEPGGNDFFSATLMEASLMARVLDQKAFVKWFDQFLPKWDRPEYARWLKPAVVSDRNDLQIVHLDGLNLSRAWCMKEILAALPGDHPAVKSLTLAAKEHTADALPHVTSGDYAGEHWLASFAVYLVSQPEK